MRLLTSFRFTDERFFAAESLPVKLPYKQLNRRKQRLRGLDERIVGLPLIIGKPPGMVNERYVVLPRRTPSTRFINMEDKTKLVTYFGGSKNITRQLANENKGHNLMWRFGMRIAYTSGVRACCCLVG
jgi:hypothetical protein